MVNAGTETFTILNGTTVIGVPVTVNAGASAAVYILPAGTPAGTYTIQAVYNGTVSFGGSTDTSQSLVISAAATATAAASASATFNVGGQNVSLNATITSPAGMVNAGTETFNILSGTTVIGVPVTVNVSAGAAAAVYVLPGGTPAGTYTIQAVYNISPDFDGSSDSGHSLTVTAAATATAAADASISFGTADQDITLNATITSPAGGVDGGTETFTILSGTTVIGVPVTVNVSAGAAAAVYVLPGDTPAGTYTIQAVYNGSPDFDGSSDSSHSLTVSAPAILVTGVSVGWGSETVSLQTQSDGLRLLPAGRTTDMPWFNINQIAITLSQAASLNPGDVSVTGITGGNYGPVTISGSGTSNVLITLSKPISTADRVTITIGNAEIITYTRRLDVLPGDVNDDGAVNTTDGVLILRNTTPAHAYQINYDLNGDGAVNTTDFNLYRSRIGTVLPGLSAQLAAGGEGPGNSALLSPGQLAPVLKAAIHQWAAAGLPAQDVARLRGVSIQIANLPAGYLGETQIDGTTIYLSADAAGYGWFVDTTPVASAKHIPPTAATALAAGSATTPTGHEDLLTVVMHELGHALGLGDLDPARPSTDLMAETLATGVRRLPSARDVAKVVHIQAFGPMISRHASLVDAVLGADRQGASVIPQKTLLLAGPAMTPHVPRSSANARSSALDMLSRRVPAIRHSAGHTQA